ncbi:TraB/GumN family protein [Caulobacter vibrioides]|uniref:TraB/GumN family protein n=1 Tax=Caulobacter vibrioides TaxID=155892 RepID=A0A290MX20_CAUVI|nr:TraB/GumN family protein [Caulobacter vibrioides]ATC32930.1 TraB/GumN family protein [Caulobacter vibrioides]
MRVLSAALAMGLAVAGGAAAQVIDDPEATVVEALVVSAKLPGPAWWRITDADTTVYILGAPGATPKGLVWDSSVADRRLNGAFALLTPASLRAGLTDIPALLALRGKLRDDGDWAASDPALAARVQRAWSAVEPKDPDGWRDWKPLFLGGMIAGKTNRKAGLEYGQVPRRIETLARKHRVKSRAAERYKAMPLIKTVARQTEDAAGLACLTETLDTIEQGQDRYRTAAQAWAEGRVRAALAAPRSVERCQLLLPGVAEMSQRLRTADVEALADLLKTPGHAVAVYPIRSLVAEGGVLDQLRAKGITVRTPGEG